MESFINSWQQLPFHISPSLFSIGSFQLRYYSLMYIVGFAIAYFLTLYRIKNEKYEYSAEIIQDYLIWAMLGVILGARLGEVLIYNFGYFIHHPLEIFLPLVSPTASGLPASAACPITAASSELFWCLSFSCAKEK